MALLTYEWRRARTIRTTWVTALVALAAIVVFAYLSTLVVDPGMPLDPGEALRFAGQNPLTLVLVASLGAMAFGHEYRYGTIRLTLTAFPKRRGVFFVKLLFTVLIPLIAVGLGLAGGYAVLSALGQGGEVDWVSLLWNSGIWALTVAVLAFTLTVITRNHPLGIVGPVLLSILETVLIGLLSFRFEWLPKVLLFNSLNTWLTDGEGATLALAVWAAWMLGLLVVSFVLLMRRDA
jgi:ABC-type transport system involved in multi-copper enzyme maturation permease subunit